MNDSFSYLLLPNCHTGSTIHMESDLKGKRVCINRGRGDGEVVLNGWVARAGLSQAAEITTSQAHAAGGLTAISAAQILTG